MDKNMYEEAIKDIKSILYDIITIEQENLQILEENIFSKSEEDKENLDAKISLKKKTLSNLRKDMLSIEKDIELLDKSNEEIDFIYTDIEEKEVENTDVLKEIEENNIEEKKEDNVENIIIPEGKDINIESQDDLSQVDDIIVEEKTQTDDMESVDIQKEKEDHLENMNIKKEDILPQADDTLLEEGTLTYQENPQTDNDATQIGQNSIEENKEVSKEENEISIDHPKTAKYTFIKTSKNITKAILVTKEQFERLTKSLEKQIYMQEVKENLKDLKDISNSIELVKSQALIEQQQFNEELTELLNMQKSQGIPKERQIEDLMVKANIYTNEGETDKAQLIYDKINELQKETEKQKVKEDSTILRAA